MVPLHYTHQHLEPRKNSGTKMKMCVPARNSTSVAPEPPLRPHFECGVFTALFSKFQIIILCKEYVPRQPCVYIYLENIHLVSKKINLACQWWDWQGKKW